MRPILVSLPSKLLFFLALLAAVGLFARDLYRRRRHPGSKLSLNPLLLAVGALVVANVFGMTPNATSFIPNGETFAHPWRPLPIYSYGVMLGTSMIAGWFVAMRFARQDGISTDDAGVIYMWTAVYSIIGARVLWYLTTPGVPLSELPMVWRGGLVAYGGMIGGLLASWYGCRKRKIHLLKWADVSAPSVVLGTGITRVGCLLFGCDFGARSELPWAIRFPQGSPAWNHHVRDLGLPSTAGWSYPVHPTQIYESLAGLFLFGLLLILRRYRKFSGQVFLGWILGYGILRPLIETVRDDEDRGLYKLPLIHASISTSQIIGLVSVVLGLTLLVYLVRRYLRDPASMRLWQQPAVAGAPNDAPAREPAAASGGGGGGGGGARKRKKRR